MNDDILNEEIHETTDISGIEPKFEIGDVVKHRIYLWTEYFVRDILISETGSHYYEISPINNPDESTEVYSESMLDFQYHDPNWEKYLSESVRNGLPAWRGELYNYFIVKENNKMVQNWMDDYDDFTIPPIYIDHIINNHTIYGRIDPVLQIEDKKRIIKSNIGIIKDQDLIGFRDKFKEKIRLINIADEDVSNPGRFIRRANIHFSDNEIKFAGLIYTLDDIKDHYPLELSCLQIMDAIREAYKNGIKTNKRLYQREKDRRTGDHHSPVRGQRVYRGESKKYGFIIEFWFDLDLGIVTTAYPISK